MDEVTIQELRNHGGAVAVTAVIAIGLGLKYPDDFKDTHLQRV